MSILAPATLTTPRTITHVKDAALTAALPLLLAVLLLAFTGETWTFRLIYGAVFFASGFALIRASEDRVKHYEETAQ